MRIITQVFSVIVPMVLCATVRAQYQCETNDTTITITKYTGQGGNIAIPRAIGGLPVTRIAENAFQACTNVTAVTIPETVTTIGNFAFEEASRLKSVVMPNTVTTIGFRAFSECRALTNIALSSAITAIDGGTFWGSSLISLAVPKSVTSIGDEAFVYCTNLVRITIPEGTAYIGDSAFDDCRSLRNINIPDTVTWIDGQAFGGTSTNLEAIVAGPANPAYASVEGVLFNKHLSTLIRFPGGKPGEYAIPEGVTDVKPWAFSFCNRLKAIRVPSSVTNLGANCFADACPNLTAVRVDEGNTAYSSKDGVLLDKRQETLIRFPQGRAGSYSVPDGVTSIGDSAFYSCTGLKSVILPNSVTSISEMAFYDCAGLTNIAIPENVTTIGSAAFVWCTNLIDVRIPETVTSIDSAFNNCSALRTIRIPQTVTNMGVLHFSECAALTDISVDKDNPVYAAVEGVLYKKKRMELLRCPPGKPGTVLIAQGVTAIGSFAFEGCAAITNIIVPRQVRTIECGAFDNCRKLAAIRFEGNEPFCEGVIRNSDLVIVHFQPSTKGWRKTFAGRPTAPWRSNNEIKGPAQ